MTQSYSNETAQLADELYIKTKQIFEDEDMLLLTMAHAYIVNQYVAFRSIEPLDYDPETQKVTGIAKDFSESTLFHENGKKIFVPQKIAELVETPTTNPYAKPVTEKDNSKRTQIALTSYCLRLGMDQISQYSKNMLLKDYIDHERTSSGVDKFNIMGRSMQQESHNFVMFGRVNNLTYGLESLLYHGLGKNRQQFGNEMADLANTLMELCEKATQENLQPEEIEDLTIERHIRRRNEISRMNMQ